MWKYAVWEIPCLCRCFRHKHWSILQHSFLNVMLRRKKKALLKAIHLMRRYLKTLSQLLFSFYDCKGCHVEPNIGTESDCEWADVSKWGYLCR